MASVATSSTIVRPHRDIAVAVLASAYVVFLLYAWPGYSSADSSMQLAEARSHVFSDWHPPAMSVLWWLTDAILRGPAGMLLLQSALFLAGAYRLCARELAPVRAAVAASALLLFPPIVAPLATVWKDSQCAGFLVLGFALIAEPRTRTRLVGLALLAIASALRYNAAAATLPLLLFVLRLRADDRGRIAIACATWIAITVAAFGANRALTRVELHAWPVSIALPDIAGTLRHAPSRPDAELRELLAGTPLVATNNISRRARTTYNPTLWWGAEHGDDRLFDWPQNDAQLAAIPHVWGRVIARYPFAYLHHRWRVFRAALAFGTAPFDPVCTEHFLEEHDLAPQRTTSIVQAPLGAALGWLARHTPLFRPWIYLAIALLLLPLARRERDVLALLLSGILSEATLLPLAPSADYRYSYTLVVTTSIAVVLLVARRMR